MKRLNSKFMPFSLPAVSGWVCLALFSSKSLPAAPTPLVSENFENSTGPLYSKLMDNSRLSLAEKEGVGNSNAIKATYSGGSMGSQRIVVNYTLPSPQKEASLCFDVKFDADFQFVKGGKLHGLGPKNSVTGGKPLTPQGWSARSMFKENGKIGPYVYHQNQGGQYGEGGTQIQPFQFQKERYHAVCYHVKVNTPASTANGLFHLYVDGVLLERKDNIQYRSQESSESEIYSLLFSTFHGGNNDSWAPKKPDGSYATVFAYFDNFEVFASKSIRSAPGASSVSLIRSRTPFPVNLSDVSRKHAFLATGKQINLLPLSHGRYKLPERRVFLKPVLHSSETDISPR